MATYLISGVGPHWSDPLVKSSGQVSLRPAQQTPSILLPQDALGGEAALLSETYRTRGLLTRGPRNQMRQLFPFTFLSVPAPSLGYVAEVG